MSDRSTNQISEIGIKKALAKVLNSVELTHSKRIQSLLKYIVEKALSGKSTELKAYTIGLDVFDKRPDFDSDKDAIVRVEMGRLRTKLTHYYLTEGKNDPIHIVVPKGTYQPTFVSQKEHLNRNENVTANKKAEAILTWQFLTTTAAIFSLIVIAVVLFYNQQQNTHEALWKNKSGLPILLVHPFKNNGPNEIHQFSTVLQAHLLNGLTQFKTLRIQRVNQSAAGNSEKNPLPNMGLYRLDGALAKTGNTLKLTINVTRVSTQSLLWSRHVVQPISSKSSLEKLLEFVDFAVLSVAGNSGVIWNDTAKALYKRISKNSNISFSSTECVMLFHGFDLSKNKKKEAIARDCLQRFVNSKTSNSSVWASWGFLRFLDWTKNHDADVLNEALVAVRTSIQLEPSNALSHEFLGSILLSAGNKKEARKQYLKAIALNPLKPDLFVLLGWQEALSGKWDEGVSKIKKSVDRQLSPPGWMRIPLSIDAFKRKDYRAALFQAEAIIQSGDNRGLILAVAAATEMGSLRLQKKYRQAFLAINSNDAGDPMKEIKSVFNDPQTLDLYAKTLEKAGFTRKRIK